MCRRMGGSGDGRGSWTISQNVTAKTPRADMPLHGGMRPRCANSSVGKDPLLGLAAGARHGEQVRKRIINRPPRIGVDAGRRRWIVLLKAVRA